MRRILSRSSSLPSHITLGNSSSLPRRVTVQPRSLADGKGASPNKAEVSGRFRTVYDCGKKKGAPASILRRYPTLNEVRGTLIVGSPRDLTCALSWMKSSCGPFLVMNLVGSHRESINRILKSAYLFVTRHLHNPQILLQIHSNGHLIIRFSHENICGGSYYVLELGSGSSVVESPQYRRLLRMPGYDGIRGVVSLDSLPSTLRYYEGNITDDLLARILEEFPHLEHVVGTGRERLKQWQSPSCTPVLRTLQVWVPKKDRKAIFRDCPSLSLLHTQNKRGHRKIYERKKTSSS